MTKRRAWIILPPSGGTPELYLIQWVPKHTILMDIHRKVTPLWCVRLWQDFLKSYSSILLSNKKDFYTRMCGCTLKDKNTWGIIAWPLWPPAERREGFPPHHYQMVKRFLSLYGGFVTPAPKYLAQSVYHTRREMLSPWLWHPCPWAVPLRQTSICLLLTLNNLYSTEPWTGACSTTPPATWSAVSPGAPGGTQTPAQNMDGHVLAWICFIST